MQLHVMLVVLLVASGTQRSSGQFQRTPVDGASCDSKSTSSVLPAWQVETFKRKSFSGCTIRSGEVAVTTNRLSVPIDITCWKQGKKPGTGVSEQQVGSQEREVLKANAVQPNHAFIINVYVDIENLFGPRWDCFVRHSDLSYKEKLTFNAFSDYKKRESFSYEVTHSGLYESDPRLVEHWILPKTH